MSLVKKIASGIAIATLVYVSQFTPAAASDLSASVNTDVNVSKHYDPAHMGHSHQCNNCKRTYHQQGDNGPNSPGSNICPYCGYSNPIPPSPYSPYNPQPSPYNPHTPQPAPYYPPTPSPYIPPAPSPYIPPYDQGYVSVDDLLRAWDAASSYQVADSILVNGSARVNSLKGLFRLAVKVYYKDSEAAIIRNMERSGIMADITVYDACQCWDGLSNYANADRVLLISARYLRNMNDLTTLMRKAYYKSTEQAIANMMSYAGGYNNNYNNQQYGHNYHRSVVKSKINENLIAGESKTVAAKNTISKKELEFLAAAKVKLDSYKEINITLTDKDIQELNYSKISEFASNFKNGSYKKTEKLFAMKKDLIKKLKPAAMQKPEVRELLEMLK